MADDDLLARFADVAQGSPEPGVAQFLSGLRRYAQPEYTRLEADTEAPEPSQTPVQDYFASLIKAARETPISEHFKSAGRAINAAADPISRNLAMPFLQNYNDLVTRDYSKEPLIGWQPGGGPDTPGQPQTQPGVGHFTGRIPALGEMILPYVAGGAPGGSGTLSAGIRAPAVITREKGPLDYDIQKLRGVPTFGVQEEFPRLQPIQGVPARIQALDNPATEARYRAALRLGLKDQEGGIPSSGLTWYNTGPLRDYFIMQNPKTGAQDFERFIDYLAASSPNNPVAHNIRTASWLYHAEKQGLPFPEVYPSKGGPSVYPPDVKALLSKDSKLSAKEKDELKRQFGFPQGYGGISGGNWIENANDILGTGAMDVLANPKPPSFGANLKGNYQPVAVDRHNMRVIAPELNLDAPPQGSYGFIEDLNRKWAAREGVTPAQGQSGVWVGAGGDTGVKSSLVLPFIGEFEDKILEAASRMRMKPSDMLRHFVSGDLPL